MFRFQMKHYQGDYNIKRSEVYKNYTGILV